MTSQVEISCLQNIRVDKTAESFCICVGREGSVTLALLNLIIEDMKSGPPSVRVPIPY